MNSYDAVIFDQDGVLLDSGLNNFLWMDRVRKKAAEKKGFSFTTQDSIKIVKCTSRKDIEEFIHNKGMKWSELKDIENQVSKKKIQMIKQGYIRIFPETHRALRKIDMPIGMATNATERSTDFTLDFFGLEKFFDSVRCVELEKGRWFECKKPAPTLLDGIREDLDAENPVMIGDTASDIGAAQATGIDSVLIESYGRKPELNPTHRVRNISELNRIL